MDKKKQKTGGSIGKIERRYIRFVFLPLEKKTNKRYTGFS